MTTDVDALLTLDAAHVWHPYASATAGAPPHVVESASGVRLRLVKADGTRRDVIDAMSSWWCAVHGYGVPELDAAATGQLQRMSHVMFGGLTHEPAIRLAERLVAMAPHPQPERAALNRVFLADSGSVSVEVAMKMALQCFAADDRPRRRILTVRGGYHGDTLHPMSVCDPDGGMHTLWRGTLPEQIFAPLPPAPADPSSGLVADAGEMAAWKDETARLFAEHADDIAAVILEPLLQGAGGMRIHDPECVRFLAELAREHGALVIFDEIATGFGRTGTLWAAERVGVTPDIMCVGKALTGGYLTLAATLCSDEVAQRISDRTGAVMHGPTFMGNPLACTVALASLDLLDAERLTRAAQFEGALEAGLGPLRSIAGVKDVRVIGAVGVVELEGDVDMTRATEAALAEGVWIRPFRGLIYTMPPYVCTDDDLATIVRGVTAAVRASVDAGYRASEESR